MPTGSPKYRLQLIQAFSLSENSGYQMRPMRGPKESMLMNYTAVAPLLADAEWEMHPGPLTPHGDWPVETREEFHLVGAARLPIVRQACESGKYNGIVLLGGGDPGFPEAQEIARRYGIPVTACASAQMQVASMLGSRFSIIDISEAHNMRMHSLVVQYRFADRCASIRNINFPLPRPNHTEPRPVHLEKARFERDGRCDMLDAAVAESIAAIEEDGAEVLMLGCSGAYWMQAPLQQRLREQGWEVPVLEGYRCAIQQVKLLIGLGLDVSGLAFPSDLPRRWRRKKLL
ncbi:aspartate/glutamate racemase family protein [Siccirubricoccus phaeus]|uniref:aspartate/glutamate racemase family protein n=1 Tax=Siccirubricoccus phaeus TaxID=2595053 RepID=UPI0011F2B9DE|nr:aspartate/glutamate racemase family protein [Siccirubricoccus phaeus]